MFPSKNMIQMAFGGGGAFGSHRSPATASCSSSSSSPDRSHHHHHHRASPNDDHDDVDGVHHSRPHHYQLHQQHQHHPSIPPELFRQGVLEHAASLGMDPAVDGALLWIAEKSLREPLPPHWSQLRTDEGDVYFYDRSTGESSWEHPKDEYYRNVYLAKKRQRRDGLGTTTYRAVDDESSTYLFHRRHERPCQQPREHPSTHEYSQPQSRPSSREYSRPPQAQPTRSQGPSFTRRLPTNDDDEEEDDVGWQNCFSPDPANHHHNNDEDDKAGSVSEMIDEAEHAVHSLKEEMRRMSIRDDRRDDDPRTPEDDERRRSADEEERGRFRARIAALETELAAARAEAEDAARRSKETEETYRRERTAAEETLETERASRREAETTLRSRTTEWEKTKDAYEASAREHRSDLELLRAELETARAESAQRDRSERESREDREVVAARRDEELRDKEAEAAELRRRLREVEESRRTDRAAAAEDAVTAAAALRAAEDALAASRARERRERERARAADDRVAELQGNVRVLCRIRPTPASVARVEEDDTLELDGQTYSYDRVFAPKAAQGVVFDEVAPAARSALDGHSVCVMAYGQTGSGKTHTMEGTARDAGVNRRAVRELFERARERNEDEERRGGTTTEWRFTVSVLEVYNETVRDLLRENDGGGGGDDDGHDAGLTIHVRKDHRVHVEGLAEREVVRPEDVERVVATAGARRRTADNNVNRRSSRSHLVLTVKVRGRRPDDSRTTRGALRLVDLAGSERLKQTGAAAGSVRGREARHINKSLSALGDVVAALGDGSKHVPYRNSKLTSLLQDSLRANARVLLFVNIDPSPESVAESVCSLKFAARCRAVRLGRSRRDSYVASHHHGSTSKEGANGGGSSTPGVGRRRGSSMIERQDSCASY